MSKTKQTKSRRNKTPTCKVREWVRGSKHGNAKLNERVVRSMRNRVAKGETMVALAKEYKVNYFTVRKAVNHQTWTHVE